MDFDYLGALAKRKQAIEDEICDLCNDPILSFEDEKSLQEYHISGLCQSCQNEIFIPDPFVEDDNEV